MPAEWEKQSAVQLTWPNEHTDWAPMLSEITAVYEEMAREISKREPLIIVDDIPHNDTWARDHGFITCLTPNPSPIGEGNTPMYNLSGQRVGASYKGIILQNGRKYIKR